MFVVLLFLCQKEYLNYKNIIRNFLRNRHGVLLGLVIEFLSDAFLTVRGL